MRLVVDANILLSAFLRDGATRELLLHAPLEMYAPPWLREEAERNLLPLAEKHAVPARVAIALLERLMTRIEEVPEPLLARHASEAIRRCTRAGAKDAPYVACALAVNAAIWTRDRVLAKEAGVETVDTEALWVLLHSETSGPDQRQRSQRKP